jgi:TonB family protein
VLPKSIQIVQCYKDVATRSFRNVSNHRWFVSPGYMIRPHHQRTVRIMLAAGLGLTQAALCGGEKKIAARELTVYRDGQVPLSASEPAISALARSLAEPLKKAKARNVIVLDLRGSGGKPHPVGAWLADRLSAAIRKEYPKINAIDRSKLISNADISSGPMDSNAIFEMDVRQARSVGADVAIIGDFAAVSNQIGISLRVVRLPDPERVFGPMAGLIPLSKEIENLTNEAIPALELEDGYPHGGQSGVGMPDCTHCPPPKYADRAGVVVLKVVVTTDGRAGTIKVWTTPDPDLSAIAVRTVQAWRFKPAIGFDGNPIAVIIPVQITFLR